MSVQKYFIAIVPPLPLLEKAEGIKQDLFENYGLKGALRSPSHITLHRPFEWKEEKEKNLIEKLHEFKAAPGFEIQLEGFAAFEPRVIYINVLPSDELNELYARLKQFAKRELKLFNESDDLRGFHPHITVASRDLKKNKFNELWPLFKERPFEGRFKFNAISLLKLSDKWEVVHTFNVE